MEIVPNLPPNQTRRATNGEPQPRHEIHFSYFEGDLDMKLVKIRPGGFFHRGDETQHHIDVWLNPDQIISITEYTSHDGSIFSEIRCADGVKIRWHVKPEEAVEFLLGA